MTIVPVIIFSIGSILHIYVKHHFDIFNKIILVLYLVFVYTNQNEGIIENKF